MQRDFRRSTYQRCGSRSTRGTGLPKSSPASAARSPETSLPRNLYAARIAYACNLGIADASGITEDTLAWTSRWYLRQYTLRAVNTRLVYTHHRHPLARLWVGGTLASSGGSVPE